MKYDVLFVMAFSIALFVPSVSHGVTVTLGYSDCLNDSASNVSYCAPPDRMLNDSLAFQTCMSNMTNVLAAMNSSASGICNNAMSNFSVSLISMNNNFTQLYNGVMALQGINLSSDYAKCIVDLNTTQNLNDLKQQQIGVMQDQMITLRNNTVDLQTFNQAVNDKNTAQQNWTQHQDDLRNGALGGLVVGAVATYAVLKRKRLPSSSLDSREGRAIRQGNR